MDSALFTTLLVAWSVSSLRFAISVWPRLVGLSQRHRDNIPSQLSQPRTANERPALNCVLHVRRSELTPLLVRAIKRTTCGVVIDIVCADAPVGPFSRRRELPASIALDRTQQRLYAVVVRVFSQDLFARCLRNSCACLLV